MKNYFTGELPKDANLPVGDNSNPFAPSASKVPPPVDESVADFAGNNGVVKAKREEITHAIQHLERMFNARSLVERQTAKTNPIPGFCGKSFTFF